jgi:excisionase family DNA binding protein
MPKRRAKPQAPTLLGQMSREHALRGADWVAEFLNVDLAWIHEATAAGTLPSIKVGQELRFDPDAIKAWGRERTSNTTAASGDDGPEFLTIDEGAELLRLNRNTLYEAIRLGQVPGVLRVGRLLRLRRADLTARALTLPVSDDLVAAGQGGSSLKEKK